VKIKQFFTKRPGLSAPGYPNKSQTSWLFRWAAILALLPAASLTASAEKVQKLHLLQDDAQLPIVTKVYDLQYARANDLTPFVLGAAKRYYSSSAVDRWNYAYGKKQFLVVSVPSALIPYVDGIVAAFDRPAPKNADGSTLAGTGISKFVYQPKFRSTSDILSVISAIGHDGDGIGYFDNSSNLVYWKDSAFDGGNLFLTIVKAFDRPIPQAELTINIYEVRQSVLDDIGVDYLTWKNGPGLNIFATGLESQALNSVEKSLANMDKFTSTSYGGYSFSPQFDSSFVRALSQAGKATITASGSLTVTNPSVAPYSRNYTIKIAPQLQNIAKNDSDQTSVTIGSDASYTVTVYSPVICFKQRAGGAYTGAQTENAVYPELSGNLQFKYLVQFNAVTERSNKGVELTQKNSLQSTLTFDTDVERLLAAYDRKQKVDQVVGVPFLSEVPGLKYLFSTTTKVDENVKVFVTIKARLVHPDDTFAAWSGKVLQPADLKL